MNRVGEYEVVRELARGGMGVVYVARHTQLGREVALKQIQGTHDAQTLKRFEAEAQLVAKLRHPNIVKVHEVGIHERQPYFTMALVEGESLERRLKREGPLPPRVAATICEALAQALAHAHQRDILHRDLKPANVLLAKDGDRPLLTDFGLAKDLSEERERLTRTGQVVGTPAYMPPEQARGKGKVDVRSDVYGLGATLYTMLTGRPPFQAEGFLATLALVVTDPPEPPSRSRPDLDRDLETICLKCLAKAPDDRYPSAAALAEDLHRYLQDEPVEARRPVEVGGGARLLGGGLLALALVVAAAFWLRPNPAPPPAKPAARTRPQKTAESPSERANRAHRVLARLKGRGWLEAARSWLLEFPRHPEASALRTRYLQVGLTHPRTLGTHPRADATRKQPPRIWLRFVGPSQAVSAGSLSVRGWDLKARRQTSERQLTATPQALCLDRKGRRMFAGLGEKLFVLSPPAARGPRRDLWTLPVGNRVEALALSPREDWLAIGTDRGMVYLVDPNDPKWRAEPLFRRARGRIREVLFTPSGDHLIVLREGKVRALRTESHIDLEKWQVRGRRRVARGGFTTLPRFVVPTPDETAVALGIDITRQISLFPLKTLRRLSGNFLGQGLEGDSAIPTRQAHAGVPSGGVFSPDGARFYTVCQGGELRVWNARTRAQIGASLRRQGAFQAAALSPAGDRLLTIIERNERWVLEQWEVDVPRVQGGK